MPKQPDREGEAPGRNSRLFFAIGAGAGLALGYLLGGRPAGPEPSRREKMVRRAARRLHPTRLRHEDRDQAQLRRMEDAVLTTLLRDDVLAERGIDVGALTLGIVELSGSVRTSGEAARAVSLASRVRGVETVVNRMEVQSLMPSRNEDRETGGGEWTGRVSGMGRRRQGEETDPGRSDDSQHIREMSLERADRQEFVDEDLAHSQPRLSARPGREEVNPTNFTEDELDNQFPSGEHVITEGQALNADSRVGEGLEPGTELRLEQADVPVKPRSRDSSPGSDEMR